MIDSELNGIITTLQALKVSYDKIEGSSSFVHEEWMNLNTLLWLPPVAQEDSGPLGVTESALL